MKRRLAGTQQVPLARSTLTLASVVLLLSFVLGLLSGVGLLIEAANTSVAAAQLAGQLDAAAIERARLFVAHNTVCFAGALITFSIVIGWTAAKPLRAGEAWAWWAIALSGLAAAILNLGLGVLQGTTLRLAVTIAATALAAAGLFVS